MKLDILDSYPDQVKTYITDYNNAVSAKDVMEVDMAINGLVSMIFGADDDNRTYAIIVLSKIGDAQFKFLKNAIRALVHRYSGEDVAKSNYASKALGQIVVGKDAAKLIKDQTILSKIISEENERLSRSHEDQAKRNAYLAKAQQVQIDLTNIQMFSEIHRIGSYYNKCLVDDKIEEAFRLVQELLDKLEKWFENNPANFTAGTILLSLMAEPQKRPNSKFFVEILNYITSFMNKGKNKQKEIYREILLHIYESIIDLIPEDMVGWLKAESLRRREEHQKELEINTERKKFLQKVTITPKLKWAVETQKLTKTYNEAIASNDQKTLNQVKKTIDKYIVSKDETVWRSTGEMIALLLEKIPNFIQNTIKTLVKNYRNEQYSEILSMMIDDLETLNIVKPQIIDEIKEKKIAREEHRKKEKESKEKERKKLDEILIKFEGDWDKKIIKIVEKANNMLLKKNLGAVKKIIESELKEYLQAKDNEIRAQSQSIIVSIVEKYPQILEKIISEYLELFNSDNDARFIAVELFGQVYHAGLLKNLFPDFSNDFRKKIEEDYDNHRKEMENKLMMEKISHIKIDVQTIPISDDWPKDMYKICRAYNDAILKQDMQAVVDQVTKIVNIFMNENSKKVERINASVSIIGLIAKKNIELIAPTINLLMEMVDNENLDTKYRAIRGLGEVTKQRPGWAYMGIEKLMKTSITDKDDSARMKSMLELSKIAAKSSVMLVEYVSDIITALSDDPNKHVRRLAAFTLGTMAEVIPLEAKDAIPALTEALHDEYFLVRKFADKALQLIRSAMRKE